MDHNRAKQILESHGVIEVLHNSSPVWIEQVHDDQAEVTMLDTNIRMEVPLEELVETESSLK